MYKWILGIVITLSLLAITVVVMFGLKPKPIPIIKASNFETPQYLGLYINRQLFQKLKTSSPIIFGFDNKNPFEEKTVNTIIDFLTKVRKDTIPDIILLPPDQSFSDSNSSKQDVIKKRYGDNVLSFTFINLKNIPPASEIQNCEVHQKYLEWLGCIKKQKVRQIYKAKKVDINKPAAIVEYQSLSDIMIYIRE